MPLAKEQKTAIMERTATHETDTGSPEVVVGLITARINYLVEHIKVHKKDHSSRRGLLKLVGQRRRLLSYLKKSSIDRYRKTVAALNLRK